MHPMKALHINKLYSFTSLFILIFLFCVVGWDRGVNIYPPRKWVSFQTMIHPLPTSCIAQTLYILERREGEGLVVRMIIDEYYLRN